MNIFPENSIVSHIPKTKSFQIELSTRNPYKIEQSYMSMVELGRKERFQSYQVRMDSHTESGLINPNILNKISDKDSIFYDSTLPFCQSYIDCYTSQSMDGNDNPLVSWVYQGAGRASQVRSEFNNKKLNDRKYQLGRLVQTIDDQASDNHIEDMVRDGTISKKDIESLKLIAKVEDIDISEVEFPDLSSDSDDSE